MYFELEHGSGSGKTGSIPGVCRLEPDPDLAIFEPKIKLKKRDLDPVYPDLDPAPSGAGSGLAGAQIITKKMR